MTCPRRVDIGFPQASFNSVFRFESSIITLLTKHNQGNREDRHRALPFSFCGKLESIVYGQRVALEPGLSHRSGTWTLMSASSQTRILVTHGLTYLPVVDNIIVLKNGVVTEQGTYKQLMERKGEFQEFLLQYLSEAEEEDDSLEGMLIYSVIL